ncbi:MULTISPECIES: GH-E family nuclease [Chryseobacterium]|uniref:Toxin YqcG C-terminal domain-containing protein n=3 Tax=Chryseobacterium TaxID=59732 RepID=A0A1N7KK31_9FLAO|nr:MULTISPECIES: GH-E family nuclease [Chryseobacterium]SIS28157.1 protein of unknown function [Chryseobacterium joostei]SIS61917.1 protein of unknown function [Chryseobacterium ureilyticum]
MAKKYVPEGAFLACDKGTSPSTLRVSFNKNTTIYAVPMATEADKLPFFHLKPMGLCTCPAKWATGVTCLPTTLQWDNPKDGVKINGNRMLLEDSTCNCIFGGKISIFFDRASAVAYGIGEGKMPSDYIKEGFDWLEQKTKENRAERDKMIPDWMKPIAGAKDWFDDLGTGLVEGAVNGVVGLGEVIYQVGQDPVGTAEALGGMVKEGYEATTKGLNEAYKWSTTPGNLEKAANSTWDWASKEENWDKLGNDIVKGAQDTGEWIAKNPRKIGTTVGEFIPDAVAAVYTAGGSVAVTAGKTALKEGAEVVVEKTVKEVAEAGAEKAGKEALEAGTKRGIAETLEQLAKKESDDIAAVVTKDIDELAAEAIKKGGKRPKLPEYPVKNADGTLTDYGKWYYERPSGFRKGVRKKAYDGAKEDGIVKDPLTKEEIPFDSEWDMGHKPKHEFRKHQKDAAEREISRKKFIDEHNNPDHYRPETQNTNRSHKLEDHTDDFE